MSVFLTFISVITKEELNRNPGFQWLAVILITMVGIFIIVIGYNAIRNKHLVGKYGKKFEGVSAQILGVLYIILGLMLAMIAFWVKFFGPIIPS